MWRPAFLTARRWPLVAVLFGLLLSGCGVNNIPTSEEKAKADWSQVLTSISAAPTSSPTWSRP